MLRKILLSAGLCWNLMWIAPVSAAPPEVILDKPADGDVLSGIVTVYGWALGSIREVRMFFDDNPEGETVGYGGERADVGAAFPGAPEAAHSGFAVALNTRRLSNGQHTIEIQATNTQGESTSRHATFLVSNAPGQEHPATVGLDLRGSQLRVIDERTILVEGADMSGQRLTTLLQFDANSDQFKMISFSDDHNHDGFQDDDADHDGFSDDDANHDGFDDGDENRNGASDDPADHDVGDDHGNHAGNDDPADHDVGDDHGSNKKG
jgi:hypothetical protein